jgi:hypothetical protein
MADAPDRTAKDQAAHGDIHVRAILWTAAAIFGTLLLSGMAAYFLWTVWRPGDNYDGPNAAFDFEIEGPRLESAPQQDYRAYLAEKEGRLHAWQWIDPRAGTVRMPVEEAMRRMAQERTGTAGGAEKSSAMPAARGAP